MKRRQFISSATALGFSASLFGLSSRTAFAQTAAPLDAVAEIKKLRINAGTFAGAYLIAPAGRINWYFINLGLLPMVQYLNAADLELYVRSYLDLTLGRRETNMSIQDVNFTSDPTGTFSLVPSDSDDSYASTTLSLAARYLQASQNWYWWDVNKARLKDIAYFNLAMSVKPNGLTGVFQSKVQPNTSIGYLMDNCESYRGLRDYAALLRNRGAVTDANYFDSFATGIADRISASLFDTSRSGFLASDAATAAGTVFYADTTCQVFPQACGVSELSAYYTKGWDYLNRYSGGWENGVVGEDFPWAVLGYVAAKRGDAAKATTQLAMIDSQFVTNRGHVTINELGYYLRTRSVLAGRKDT